MDYSPTLEEVLKGGEALYLNKYRDELEASHLGEFAVIDVLSERYVVDADKLVATQKAEAEFGDHLFYIVQVGQLNTPTKNFRSHALLAWGL